MGTIQVKRRLTGAAGGPATMLNGELAYNETEDKLYYGKGDGGGGAASSIIEIAGVGAFLKLTGNQTVGGVKTFSASPVVPTVSQADNSTKAATTAFVKAAIAALVDTAPGTLDTLNELAAALGDDPNFASSITTSLSGKADLTLSNISNAATARTNLGLGNMAVQNKASVDITGGTIDGVDLTNVTIDNPTITNADFDIDGGTY